jgi:hypothetical protein
MVASNNAIRDNINQLIRELTMPAIVYRNAEMNVIFAPYFPPKQTPSIHRPCVPLDPFLSLLPCGKVTQYSVFKAFSGASL